LKQAREHVAAFATADEVHSTWLVTSTLALYVGMALLGKYIFAQLPLNTCWGATAAACWGLVRVGTFVRAFIVMHDALHGALFKRRWKNELAAILTGLLNTVDAPDYGRTHGQHHAVLGVEEAVPRDPEIMVLWTTKEWAAWPWGLSKAAARMLCDPLVFYTLFPLFFIMGLNVAWPHRVTHHSSKARVLYIMCRLVAVPAILFGLFYAMGSSKAHIVVLACVGSVLSPNQAELAAMQVAASYAFFLFQAQHVFVGAYRTSKVHHDRGTAALQGSSYLSMPGWWEWATLGVEYHHIHHLNVRVPCYRLKACHHAAPTRFWEAAGVYKLTARDGWRTLVLSLWDPEQQRYVPFPEWAWLDRLLEG